MLIDNIEIKVHYKIVMTMVDGKVINSITSTSSQICYVCGAKPKEMNRLDEETADHNTFQFGLSTLHAWIRCLECLLHISYRLEI